MWENIEAGTKMNCESNESDHEMGYWMITSKKIASLVCFLTIASVSVAGATFHPGDRGEQIAAIQNALVRNGSDIAVDGDYGTGTKEAVKAFQERHGLDVDGIVGAQTYEALMGAAMPENVSSHFIEKKAISSKGKKNVMFPLVTTDNAISVVQQALANKGYNLDVDGVFGVGTEQAVRKFQADNGLDVDGVVGKATFYALTGESLPGGPLRRFGNGGYGSATGTANSRLAKQLLGIANQYKGVPYVFGGSTPSGFDCSGFTRYVYSAVGISLPRCADEQYSVSSDVSMSNLQPGDLVFFSTYEPGISHVGIYIGDSQFINASNDGVSVADLNSRYWASRYVGAKRVING